MVFNDIEEIKKFLDTDKDKKDFSPIRLINVETLEMWVKLKTYLVSICSETITLSSFCEEKDTTPNLNRFISKLKTLDSNTLVSPISEHIRVNNSIAKQTLERILKANYDIDCNEKAFRIYIPIYRMKSLIKDLSGGDKRYSSSIIFVDTPSDIDYSLTIIQNSLNININGNEIFGYRQYLSYWEQNPDRPIILHTGNAIYYKNIVFSDNVRVIVSAFDLLKYHYNLSESINNEWGTESQWNELARQYTNINNNIETVMLSIFNIYKYDSKVLLSNWEKYTDFEKWALWIWLKVKEKDGYLSYVIDSSQTYEDFEEVLCNQIIGLVNHDEYRELYIERKHLLNLIKIHNFPYSFWIRIEQLSGIAKLKCLTDISEKERASIILILKDVNISNQVMELVNIIYPELYWYLDNLLTNDKVIDDYFNSYKLCKIRDNASSEFLTKVNELARQKGSWWHLDSRNYVINNLYNDDAIIYYIDALGVEYIQLISNILKSKGINFNVKVAYCNLPSITEFNNDFMQNRNCEKEYDLDKKKHDKADYPINIIKELDLISRFVNKAVDLLNDYKIVIITSDHGTSRLAVTAKGKTIKANETAKVERHGRYCAEENSTYGDKVSSCIDHESYHVIANYDRFSISGAPLGEVHGGATLEEVLVPVITLTRESIIVEQINIELLTPEIKQVAGTKIKVKFKLSKKVNNVVAVVDNKRYNCVHIEDYWYFEPEIDKKDSYTAKIVSKETIGVFEYKVKKGISSNFDI